MPSTQSNNKQSHQHHHWICSAEQITN